MAEAYTVRKALEAAAGELARAGVDSPLAEARILLAHLLGTPLNRLDLLAGPSLSPSFQERFSALVAERATRRPLAYVIGETEFMGLRFRCDERALVPRPETEILVEVVADALSAMPPGSTILDIGAGTGVIGLSLAVMIPSARVILTDISRAALELAQENAEALKVGDRASFLEGADLEPVLLAGLAEEIVCVVSNPPYVAPRDVDHLPPEVARYEPMNAWLGEGESGTGFYERLIPRCAEMLTHLRLAAFEVGIGQAALVSDLCQSAWPYFDVRITRDLSGIERVVIAQA